MTRSTCGDAALLRRVPYFTSLPDEILQALLAAAYEKRCGKGEVIFLEGEPCAGLHVIAQGEVKIFKVSPQGREQVLHQIEAGATFNDVAVLDGGPNPASAGAVTDVSLCVIARDDIRRLAQAYPALAWAMIESISRRARHLVAMVEDLSLRSVKSRLARLLLAQAALTPGDQEIDRSRMVTQAELAARLGTVREMIGRALRDLSDEGWISFDRHRIVILDREGLEAIGEGM